MQIKIEAIEKRVATENTYINLEMLGSSPFTQEVDVATSPQGFKLPPWNYMMEWLTQLPHQDILNEHVHIRTKRYYNVQGFSLHT